jgi:hypothetical protein
MAAEMPPISVVYELSEALTAILVKNPRMKHCRMADGSFPDVIVMW